LVLHTPADSGSASLGMLEEPAHAQRVRVETLDAVWRAAGSPRVRLLKMDVEGAEPMVLAGATDFFTASRPVVCCEINPEALARLGFAPKDVYQFFRAHSYCSMIWNKTERRLVPHPYDPGEQAVEDVVFMPHESSPTMPGALP